MTSTQFYRPGPMSAGSSGPLPALGQNLQSLTALSQDFWLSIFDLSTNLVEDSLQMMGSAAPCRPRMRPRQRICEIPQYPCPNPRLGTVVREAYVGEQIRVPLRLKNKTRKVRTFQFTAQPLLNVRGEPGATLDLNPTEYTLEPGEVKLVDTRLSVSPNQFQPGFDYTGNIVITSEKCDPQILKFTLRVKSEDAAPVIKLGCPCDPPVRRVNWYDHFYCDVEDNSDIRDEEPNSDPQPVP